MTRATQHVFILSTAYSGSTLLGSMLNAHSQIGYVGELSRMSSYYKKYHLDHEEGGCTECLIASKDCKILDDKLCKDTQNISILDTHKALSNELDKQVIVDGSKHVEWLRIATPATRDNANIKAIILARNPVDYIQSCKDRGINQIWAEANAWRDTYYDALRTTSQLNVPSIVIQFEQFMAKPQHTLMQICKLLGVVYEPMMIAKTKQPLHAIGGNPGAYKTSANQNMLSRLHKKLGQGLFDINPTSLKRNKRSTKIDAEVTGAAFMTPGLVDMANLMGYRRSQLFPHK